MRVRLQALRRQYEMLIMEEGESISQYFDNLVNLANHMTKNGDNITDLMKIEKVMRTLTPRFDHIVVALEESKDLDSMNIEELQASLEAHELRLIDIIKEKAKGFACDQACRLSMQRRENTRKERSLGMINLTKLVKVQVRITKVTRKKKQSLHQVRRRKQIRKISSATIVISGVMKLNLFKMKIQI